MKRQLRGDRNQCAACGEYFNSASAFDKHRVGEFGKDRGCMGLFEMAHVGMHYGADGFWRGSKMPAALLDQVAASGAVSCMRSCAASRIAPYHIE